jgi:hypothetical protein
MRAAHRTEGGSGARDRAEATREEVQSEDGMPGGQLQGVEGYHGEHRAMFSFVVCTQVPDSNRGKDEPQMQARNILPGQQCRLVKDLRPLVIENLRRRARRS